MKARYNATGKQRKAMVDAIAAAVDIKPKYQGMPSAAYEIGDYTVLKDGTLEYDDKLAKKEVETVKKAISDAGFECLDQADDLKDSTTALMTEGARFKKKDADTGLSIEIPLQYVNIENLKKIIEAKGVLIRHSLGIDDVNVKVDKDVVIFPWFGKVSPDDAMTYARFIIALCKLTVDTKRVTAKEKKIDNEKYAFRCFLLRLGFIGEEFKNDRKILMRNLKGSAAFKDGGTRDEISR